MPRGLGLRLSAEWLAPFQRWFACSLTVAVSLTLTVVVSLACTDGAERSSAPGAPGAPARPQCAGAPCDGGADAGAGAHRTLDAGAAADAGSRDASSVLHPPSPEDATVMVRPTSSASETSDAGPQQPAVDPAEAGAVASLGIDAIAPSLARPGETVIVNGRGFAPRVDCHVSGAPAVCEVLDDRRLELRVPESLLADRCQLETEVELFHPASGQSASSVLKLVRPAPSYTVPATLHPTQVLDLAVTGLSPFTVTLGGYSVLAAPGPQTGNPLEHVLTLEIPQTLEPGEHPFKVSDQCGESNETVAVIGLPTIKAGPPTLAPGGVALLALADLQKDDLVAVRLGDESITPSDGASMQWLSPGPETAGTTSTADSLLAIRAPSQLSPGPARFDLITRHGTLEWSFEVLNPEGLYPQSPAGILGISPAASGVFPISTIAASGLVTDADGGSSVSHDFEYRLTLRSAGREDCPIARAGKGEIYGEERVKSPPFSHPLAGEYELHAEANSVRLAIDRTVSGGVVEEYAGGWVSYPGADPYEVELPPPDQRATPPELKPGGALLLLTSQRTGRQLLIKRDLDDEEERTRVRGCMMELP